MNNFEFSAPTQVIFGKGQWSHLVPLIPQAARVLLVYGQGSIKKSGAYDQVRRVLSSHFVLEFEGVRPNPEYEEVIRALPLIQQHQVDFIVSVGGGSVIDASKFLAAAACYPGEPWDILKTQGRCIQKALPHGAVLTLPATGTEMNRWGVMSRRALNLKLDFGHPALFLKFALLDPSLTYTLPKKQITNGIVDAFTHVMEQYITYPMDVPLQDRLAEAVLLTLIEEGRRILKTPEMYEARANFMWAATLALNGLIEAGAVSDWTTHMIGHSLTALYGLDHAETLAVLLPATFKVLKDQKREKLARCARYVWHLKDAADGALADAAITAIERFFQEVGAKTRLRDYGIHAEAFPKIVAALEASGVLPLGERKNVDRAKVLEILKEAY